MSGGIQGTFAIDWSQVEVDGMPDLQPEDLGKGARWAWRGRSLRLDGSQELLLLGNAAVHEDMRRRAANTVRKLIHTIADVTGTQGAEHEIDDLDRREVRLTDGHSMFAMTIAHGPKGPVAVFVDQLPEAGVEYWVVDCPERGLAPTDRDEVMQTGMAALAPGTPIRTAKGDVAAIDLAAGDWVETLDHGLQQIVWLGQLAVSAARMHDAPNLRPVSIQANAFEMGVPRSDMLVSQRQKILVSGDVALDLYNSQEVLVSAKDLVNGRTIALQTRERHVQYVFIMLTRHEVIWANDIPVESFHPGMMDLAMLGESQRRSLFASAPYVAHDPMGFGDPVRRRLTTTEAAILDFAS